MIIVKLRGGLGNQMFQYAFGKKLALEKGAPLKLDLSWFSSSGALKPKREYDLGIFSIKPEIASKFDIIKAKLFHRYFAGFWQSEKYFKSIEAQIRTDFSFARPVSENSREIHSAITRSESVCLHVRRSDFVDHGMCIGIPYYEQAMKKMLSLVPQGKFFIFSDDIEWCRSNLNFLPQATFVENSPAKSAGVELQLMAECKHFIIPNSTFAWWAAWLGTHKGKIVIAPATWLLSAETASYDTVPDAWIRI